MNQLILKKNFKKSFENLARILRIDQKRFASLIENLGVDFKIIDEIYQEKNRLINEVFLRIFNWYPKSVANEIFNVIFQKVRLDNFFFEEFFHRPNLKLKKEIEKITFFVKDKLEIKKGYFLKWEKGIEFLKKYPPSGLMNALGYLNIEEMLQKENLKEVISALRFTERQDELLKKFLEFSQSLTPNDFEEREIEIIVLDEKYLPLAKEFCQKKLHNVSHLKEYGIIFVVPTELDLPGALLRLLVLLFHYDFEIDYYSQLFRQYLNNPNFPLILNSLLEGKTPEKINENEILIVPRYFFKEDEWDFRLFIPRINTEAYHYTRSIKSLVNFASSLGYDLSFWANLEWVGEYFPDENGIEVLVSFNLADVVMNLVEENLSKKKVIYHQQEAIWNFIFQKFIGQKNFEALIKENALNGAVEIKRLKSMV